MGELMRMYKSQSWQYEKTGLNGNCELFGVNIFDYQWKRTGERIKVKDPAYQQDHVMQVYQVEINGIINTFGICEYSNCVYGFYLFKNERSAKI